LVGAERRWQVLSGDGKREVEVFFLRFERDPLKTGLNLGLQFSGFFRRSLQHRHDFDGA